MDPELEKKIKRVEPTKAESKRLYDQPLRVLRRGLLWLSALVWERPAAPPWSRFLSAKSACQGAAPGGEGRTAPHAVAVAQ